MRPDAVFDAVWRRVQEYQAIGIPAVQPDTEAQGGGPARVGNVRLEYIADFERCGRRVLTNPHRLNVFVAYYCRALPYRVAIAHSGLKPGTFKWHAAEIKRQVGRELLRAGLFPPRRYHERVHVAHTAGADRQG